MKKENEEKRKEKMRFVFIFIRRDDKPLIVFHLMMIR